MQRARMLSAITEALEAKRSIKIKLRVEITYVKIVAPVDGEINKQTVQAPMTTSNDWTIAKGHAKSILDKLIDELNTKSETLEAVDQDGKPFGSGRANKSSDKTSHWHFWDKAYER